MGRYLDIIIDRFKAQEAKGVRKYGVLLEDNHGDIDYRLEHLSQELTDGLMYIEWYKDKASKMQVVLETIESTYQAYCNPCAYPGDCTECALGNIKKAIEDITG